MQYNAQNEAQKFGKNQYSVGCAVCFNAIHNCGHTSDPFANKPSALSNFMLQCLRTLSISGNFPRHLGTLCFALLWSQLIWLDPIWAKNGNHFYPLERSDYFFLAAFLDKRNYKQSVFKAFIFPSLYNLILVSRFLHI